MNYDIQNHQFGKTKICSFTNGNIQYHTFCSSLAKGHISKVNASVNLCGSQLIKLCT